MRIERRIDSKGRITIPKAIREQLGIEPGESVEVAVDDGRIVIQHSRQREQSVRSLRGCLTTDRKRDETRTDPLELKDDWTSDLPE